ncbi:MAG TPA: WD40 repeat domain-containing protein [Dehalococcoidia bacterium]|nr:WD40 repeat domain-containing protein [Dehalococcoidia bacterium]
MIKHRSPISGIDAFGGHYVATAGYDGQLILWDSIRRKSLARGNHDHLVNQCRFSTCGNYLVSSSSDYTARIWRVPSLQLVSVLGGHGDDVEMAAPDPGSTRVVTASRDHRIRIFDFSGRERLSLAGHAADVLSIEWSRDGQQLVSSGDDGTVRRWSANTGELLQTVELGDVETDTVATDGEGLLFAGNDRGEIVTIQGDALVTTGAHRAGVKRLAFDRRGRRLLSTSYDRTLKIWEVTGRGWLELLRSTVVPEPVWVRAAAFAASTKIVLGTFGTAYATYDAELDTWDLRDVEATSGLNAVRVIGRSAYAVGDAGAVFRDSKPVTSLGSPCNFLDVLAGRLITGGHSGALFDARTGEALFQHSSPLNCSVVFLRDQAEHIIIGTYTGEGLVFCWRPGQGLKHVTTVRLHDNAVKGLACNGQEIFSVCATGAVAFHRSDDFVCIRRIIDAHEKISNGAVVLPDRRFASVSRDRKLRLWSADSCEILSTPHDHSVKCVAASADAGLIATGSYGGTVAIYDLVRRTWIATERPTTAGISGISVGHTPRSFLACSYDGEVYTISA